MKKIKLSRIQHIFNQLSIGQSLLVAILSIVIFVLLITSFVSYYIFSNRTTELIESQSREVNKQIILNYQSYIDSIIEVGNFIQDSSLEYDLNTDLKELENLYTLNTKIKKDIISISLFEEDGSWLIGKKFPKEDGTFNSQYPWFKKAKESPEIFHFMAPNRRSISQNLNDQSLWVSKVLSYIVGGEVRKGVLLIELNFNRIIDYAKRANLGEGGHILIIEEDDSLIYNSLSQGNFYPSSYLGVIQCTLGEYLTSLEGQKMYVNINTLPITRWRIATISNVNNIALAIVQMQKNLIYIFIISVFFTSLIALSISRRITRPLYQLTKAMENIEKGDFSAKLKIDGQKEILLLEESFNSMIDEVRSLMDRVVQVQRNKRKSEFVALQNQINPHFLYNTLDSIVWLAENERNEDVITTVVALARFFRISISKGHIFIPVASEISHIENYLTIQQIRYVNKFSYSIEVDPELKHFKVMKLLLQPIVENAIYHGIGEEQEHISIRVFHNEDFLFFEVQNGGFGITDEKINQIYQTFTGEKEAKSVGLSNVYQRLKIYYGDNADLQIESVLDEMTLVRIIIPFTKIKQERDIK